MARLSSTRVSSAALAPATAPVGPPAPPACAATLEPGPITSPVFRTTSTSEPTPGRRRMARATSTVFRASASAERPLATACVPAQVRREAPAAPGPVFPASDGIATLSAGAPLEVSSEARASFWVAWSAKKKAAAAESGREGSCS